MNSKRDSAVPVILVVDDEPSICWGLEKLLTGSAMPTKTKFDVVTASSAEEGLAKAAERNVALVVLDVRLPGEDGISALPKFRAATDDAPIIVMTAFGDLQTAVSAIQGGATDYLTKPFSLDAALVACKQALRRHFRDDADDSSTSDDASGTESQVSAEDDQALQTAAAMLVGRSPAMQQVFRQIALVADSDLSVLITGETGTGKELVAAAIHRHSRRCDRPYLAVAPATFSETVVESELFGHVKGAFTGANEDRKGLFELADGGTVLLDEIGDLNRSTQVKLLRVIEQGEFTAVGDVRPRRCDVRIIAATNRDLQTAIDDGSFREDLMYRLAAVSIRLPPLRQRHGDLPLLCEYFLRRLGYPDAGKAIDAGLQRQLELRPWDGNVRELRNAVEHASVIARGRPLTLDDFPPPQTARNAPWAVQSDPYGSGGPGYDVADGTHESSPLDSPLAQAAETWTRQQLDSSGQDNIDDLHERLLAATEPAVLKVVLEHTDGNRAAAAKILGIHRGTLRDRIKRYGEDTADDDGNEPGRQE
ncbi:Nitrogen regulation protein NR(I) [Rubripirellula lacrimiformis]|uniref:DNA-binding transcriptional regulator NtrC n=1 Tax=Rubripirellula lacrimiformis TaxID=1930273 RepID=A0A517NHQ8_9BACT|nr:sigma-54 dependent transcriptional regulator [Rubripirellula lacrimiformis]QDT06676.1 Nitrogen regulation protein NR(I) [Rubripirellula lacrimiformis]